MFKFLLFNNSVFKNWTKKFSELKIWLKLIFLISTDIIEKKGIKLIFPLYLKFLFNDLSKKTKFKKFFLISYEISLLLFLCSNFIDPFLEVFS